MALTKFMLNAIDGVKMRGTNTSKSMALQKANGEISGTEEASVNGIEGLWH